MDKIYMLRASAQSGKNTVAELIKKYYEDKYNKNVIIIAEADYVKYVLLTYYGIEDFKSKEGRTKIQKFATDKVRAKDPLMWSRVVTSLLNCIQDDFDVAVIPDLRFLNEYENMDWVFPGKVKTVSIERPDINSVDNMTEEQRSHQSETEMANYNKFDYKINNITGNFDWTFSQVVKMIDAEEKE